MSTEAVPFARSGARFRSDFEDLVVWLVTRSDKSTVAAFPGSLSPPPRVAWRTVVAMWTRVAGYVIDPHRLEERGWSTSRFDETS